MIQWIDAHTHLDSDELFAQKDEVLQRAMKAGVTTLLIVNSEATSESFSRTAECLKRESSVHKYAAFGIHPHQADQLNDEMELLLREYLKLNEVVALGEIGLDFYYDYSPRDVQQSALIRQLQLSTELGLPVVIHCRDAYGTLAKILSDTKRSWKGMIHCFTGNAQEAETLMNLGFHISFSGIVTFRNADVSRQAALVVPMDRMLVETDAPFLAPVPFRGRTNEPAFVVHTGEFLAQLKGIPVETFAAEVARNFSQLFLNSW